MRIQNVILGGGPAGIQLALFLAKRGQPYVIIERSDHAGAFFDRYPRHGKLLSINKCYTGYPDLESRRRYDWNALICDEERLQFPHYSKAYFPDSAEIPRYLADVVAHYDVNVQYNTEVVRVTKEAEGFSLALADGGKITCERLFVGTGVSQENVPDVEGVELCETYAGMSVDPEDFIDKRVMIVGKGNSAFETAENLVETSRKIWVCGPRTVRLAWQTHYVGDLRAVNNNFLDTYQLKAQNNILDGQLKRVRRDEESGGLVAEVYFESRKRSYDYPCDHVLLCTGFRFDDSIFDESCRPQMRSCGRLPLMTCEWESENVQDMFFIGTLMQSRDYRKTMSGFIHGFRHNIEALDRVLERRGTGVWRQTRELPLEAEAIAETVLDRISTSAGLLLQPGFLCDAVLFDRDRAVASYLEDVPVDYVHELVLAEGLEAFLVTLEYKKQESPMDPFNLPRGVTVPEDYYIHPIVRQFVGTEQVGRFYLPDDLDNDWRMDAGYLPRLVAEFRELMNRERRYAQTAQSFVSELGGKRSSLKANGEKIRSN